jgi:hypothetical protein
LCPVIHTGSRFQRERQGADSNQAAGACSPIEGDSEEDRQATQAAGSVVKVLFCASLAISAKGSPVSRERGKKIVLFPARLHGHRHPCFQVPEVVEREDAYGECAGGLEAEANALKGPFFISLQTYVFNEDMCVD